MTDKSVYNNVKKHQGEDKRVGLYVPAKNCYLIISVHLEDMEANLVSSILFSKKSVKKKNRK